MAEASETRPSRCTLHAATEGRHSCARIRDQCIAVFDDERRCIAPTGGDRFKLCANCAARSDRCEVCGVIILADEAEQTLWRKLREQQASTYVVEMKRLYCSACKRQYRHYGSVACAMCPKCKVSIQHHFNDKICVGCATAHIKCAGCEGRII